MHPRSGLFSHFPHGARQAARPAVGNGVVQIPVPRLEQNVQDLLLLNGIPYLHCPRRNRLGLGGQFAGGKSRPVYSVAAGLAAGDDDRVAFHDLFANLVPWHNSHTTAIHQRIADKALIEKDGTVDRRDSHLVAVVPHAVDHSLHDPFGMQGPRRQFGERRVRPGEAKDIRIAHRLGAESRSEDVPDNPADPGIRAAERLQGGRVVVGFDFETQMGIFVELDDPGVIVEYRYAPRLGQALRGLDNSRL